MSSTFLNDTKQNMIDTNIRSKNKQETNFIPNIQQSKNVVFNKKITTEKQSNQKLQMLKSRIQLNRQPISNGELQNGSTTQKQLQSSKLINPQPDHQHHKKSQNTELIFCDTKNNEKKYRINLNYKDNDCSPSTRHSKKQNNHVSFQNSSNFQTEKNKLGGDLHLNVSSSPQKSQENLKNSKRISSKVSMIAIQYPENQEKDGSNFNFHNSNNFETQQQLFQIPHKNNDRGLSESFNFAFPSTNFQNNDQYQQQNEFVIFQKAKGQNLKSSVNKSTQGQNMFALQIILQASGLYDNYLKRLQNRKQSLNIMPPQADLIIKEKLPRQFFYKPERIIFNKPKDDLSYDYNYNGFNKIYKMNEDRTKFYYQDLKLEQLHNMRGLKSNQITFPQELKINKNIEYDNFNKRFYFFSNEQQKILVFSEASQEMLCSVKVKNKVNDPHLFIHQVNNRHFLLIIGGYWRIEKDIVQGSKFIEIFQLMRWEIELNSKVINLITGRISPIILTVPQINQNKILILGGNTIAQMTKSGNLNYDYQKDMNQSTNLTGLSISSHQIVELFDIKEQAICYNHSVKLSNPLSLHDGCTIPLNNTNFLLLPGNNYLFQLKIFNKQINIIEGKSYPYLPKMNQFQRREICLRITKEGLIIYRITEQGQFQIITQEDKIQRTCLCLIY